MVSKILMPASGQTAKESRILKWHVVPGDEINRGDVLFEIETDKATMEVESYAKGNLLKICFDEGELAEAGAVVAYIGKQGEHIEEDASAEIITVESDNDYTSILKQEKKDETKISKQKIDSGSLGETVQASPAARMAARKNNIDLAELYAELGKPVKVGDVLCAGENKAVYETSVPSAMRKTIAKRMLQSVQEAPQFTISIRTDMSNLVEMRNSINNILKEEGIKVSYNDMLVKCLCLACRKHPLINSVYTDEEIRILKNVNVGIAVALDDGLVVPVIQKAQTLSLKEISFRSNSIIQNAKNGKMEQDAMRGGTITISNLGMYDIHRFTALINRPENAILAVGAIVETPVGINGVVELRPICEITATFDHRLIDGALGARFMGELKKIIESPLEILL